MAEFKDRLKDLRMAKGLSQREFISAFNKTSKYEVSRAALSLWETGKRTPQLETAQCLADFFDVSLDYMLGKADEVGRVPVEEVMSWSMEDILKWAETADLRDVKTVLRVLTDRLLEVTE